MQKIIEMTVKPALIGGGLATCLLALGACSVMRKPPADPVDNLRAAIERTVADEDRKAEVLILADEWARLLEQESVTVREARRSLDQLVFDYHSERKDIEVFFAGFRSRRSELADRIIDIHMAMKDVTTNNEWNSLKKPAGKMTEAILTQGLAGAT